MPYTHTYIVITVLLNNSSPWHYYMFRMLKKKTLRTSCMLSGHKHISPRDLWLTQSRNGAVLLLLPLFFLFNEGFSEQSRAYYYIHRPQSREWITVLAWLSLQLTLCGLMRKEDTHEAGIVFGTGVKIASSSSSPSYDRGPGDIVKLYLAAYKGTNIYSIYIA